MSRLLTLSLLVLALGPGLVPDTAQGAETRYVSDQLQVTLRSGQSTQHKILRLLASGTRLSVLETNADSGYSRVRTPDGTVGWVLTRYLMDQPAARARVAEAETTAERLRQENAELEAKIESLTTARGELAAARDELSEEKARLEQELAEIRRTSGRAIEIAEQNQQLKERVVALEKRLETANNLNAELRQRHEQRWFVAGAGVLLGGLVLGLIAPRLRRRSRQRWDSV